MPTMHLSALAQLGLTGLLVALLPLTMVWVSADANKYRKLVWIAVFLTVDLIMFGGFTRLSDSGLGCPDWPGCYGSANPFLAHEHIVAAETLMPSGPVTVVESLDRNDAPLPGHGDRRADRGDDGAGLAPVAKKGWTRKPPRGIRPGPADRAVFLCLPARRVWRLDRHPEAAAGDRHHPFAAGHGTVVAAGVAGRAPGPCGLARAKGRCRGVRAAPGARAGHLSAVLLALQIALGGWVSTNYAALACTDFPLCGGKVIPAMDFEHGFYLWRELGKTAAGHYLPFSALTAIHWVHRNFALIVLAGVGYTVLRAWPLPSLRGTARLIALVLALQAATGMATIYLNWPLAIAVLHNGGAALLVLLLTMLNYKAKFQLDAARNNSVHRDNVATAPSARSQK